MASGFGSRNAGAFDGLANPAGKLDGRTHGGRVRVYQEDFDLSLAAVKKASGDTNFCFRLPAGSHPFIGYIESSATLATTTVEIGIIGAAGKYRASAVFTAINTPTPFMVSAALDDAALTADEDVYIKFGTADAPGAGIVSVTMLAGAY
jgi:hypothetical protein